MDQPINEEYEEELDPPLMWIVIPTGAVVVGFVVFLVAFFLR
jgi:hypothetical protein